MRFDPWIAASGTENPKIAFEMAESFARENPGCQYIAFHTDHFSSGRAKDIEQERLPSLLDMRIFTAEEEYRMTRTCVSNDFEFRVASDACLAEFEERPFIEDPFLLDPDHFRMETRQILDINTEYPPYRENAVDERGCRLLCTTGGGHYALPIEAEDRVAVVVYYFRYDNATGVCKAVDERLAGFEPLKEGENQ